MSKIGGNVKKKKFQNVLNCMENACYAKYLAFLLRVYALPIHCTEYAPKLSVHTFRSHSNMSALTLKNEASMNKEKHSSGNFAVFLSGGAT